MQEKGRGELSIETIALAFLQAKIEPACPGQERCKDSLPEHLALGAIPLARFLQKGRQLLTGRPARRDHPRPIESAAISQPEFGVKQAHHLGELQ